ncbi:E7 protein [Bos taurus papillomavirus 20]|uniref:Protein E7 n=1 Tax=Bos taurus papillomavirus 20 TaxID=1887218 RepID=A0A1B2K2C2_9PAPI|nr:E7 protein [Bos taurus papillomavirus 20]ANZ90258.1 E7 protein [Bos taurus papillomavirus 20]
MRGTKPTIKDITLELEQIVSPANLLCEEVLPPEGAVRADPYTVALCCCLCEKKLHFGVIASEPGIRQFEQLLVECLGLLCSACNRQVQQKNGL